MNLITFDHLINDTVLERTKCTKDLGDYLDFELTSTIPIQDIIQSALNTLDFLSRNNRNFTNVSTFKILYNCFVRSKLE